MSVAILAQAIVGSSRPPDFERGPVWAPFRLWVSAALAPSFPMPPCIPPHGGAAFPLGCPPDPGVGASADGSPHDCSAQGVVLDGAYAETLRATGGLILALAWVATVCAMIFVVLGRILVAGRAGA